METNYKPNSHKSKERQGEAANPEKKVEKVITGTAKTKKKSEIRKFTDIFVSEDIANVRDYIFIDVFVPAVKKAIVDIVSTGIEKLFYGESSRSGSRPTASKVSYGRYYDRSNDRREVGQRRDKSAFNYDDILFENRGDAEAVLTALDDVIAQYGFASVGDLYELADITSPSYTVTKYGWTDLRSASVVRVRDGYVIKLPRALPFN